MICPRCGAENQQTAKLCRMCATPLEAAGPVSSPPAFAPKAAPAVQQKSPIPPPSIPVPTGTPLQPSSAGPGEILCATCKAVNDSSWAYCQQCGSQLHKPAPQQSPTPVQKPASPAPPPPRVSPTPPAPPRPVSELPKKGDPNPSNILTCVSCGRINTPGSSFCATCGAPLPVDHTIQMRPVTTMPRLRLIQEGGGEGELYKLDAAETVIGRNTGDIRFPHDGYMSGKHARIIRKGEKFILVDESSRNGTFKRIDGEAELKAGDIILIGKQLFRFEL